MNMQKTHVGVGSPHLPGSVRRTPYVHTCGLKITSKRLVAVQSSSEEDKQDSSNTCPTCGIAKDKMAFGCDGSGRIMGGLASIPGFGWWPIKAYRPCGKAVEAGIEYKRKGQGVDEVMFGRK